MRQRRSINQRFAEKCRHDEKTGCIMWAASRNQQGYGKFNVTPKKARQAHRFAWELYCGSIPEGMQVLHRCDQPGCVNVGHLFLGTQQDNIDDMRAKGRQRYADGGRPFKFDEETIRAVINSEQSADEIAARLGVHRSTVFRWRARHAG